MYVVSIIVNTLMCFALLLEVSGDNSTIDCFDAKAFLVLNVKFHFDMPFILNPKGKIQKLLKDFVPSLVTKVEELYRQPAMSLPLKINIISIQYLWSGASLTQKDIFKTKYIENYCKWQDEQKEKVQQTWLSVIFTELNLYNKYRRPVLGTSYSSLYCLRDASCIAVNFQSNADIMALILAHEIAHSIGVYHDEGKKCEGFHTMRPSHDKTGKLPKTWSNCSRNYLNEFLLRTDDSWCIGDEDFRLRLSMEYLNN